MEDNELLEIFNKNLACYDKANQELRGILELVNFQKDQNLIDIGAGIGRLSVPLSYKLNVVAVEPNKILANKTKEIGVRVINEKIENFFPEEKFDYALLAWPQFDNRGEVFEHIKKNILKSEGRLIVIKPIDYSLKQIANKLFPHDFGNVSEFFEILSNSFVIEKQKDIKTDWTYSGFEETIKLLNLELEAYFSKPAISKTNEKIIEEFIKQYCINDSILFYATMAIAICKPSRKS